MGGPKLDQGFCYAYILLFVYFKGQTIVLLYNVYEYLLGFIDFTESIFCSTWMLYDYILSLFECMYINALYIFSTYMSYSSLLANVIFLTTTLNKHYSVLLYSIIYSILIGE